MRPRPSPGATLLWRRAAPFALTRSGGARGSYERALAIWEHVLGEHHPNTRTVRANLDRLGGG